MFPSTRTFLLGLAAGAVILCAMLTVLWAQPSGWEVPTPTPPAVVDTQPDSSEKEIYTKLSDSPGISWRQRREMGITFRNIRTKMKELKVEGRLEDLDRSAAAALVLDELVADNPKAFADPSLDWDSLLSFIERILAIIARFISF